MIAKQTLPSSTRVIDATTNRRLSGREIVHVVAQACNLANPLILIEGGPQLMRTLFAERLLDEQFLTLAPQIAGRDDTTRRPGLVDGEIFAPKSQIWGTLVGIKRAGEHLFLRYTFETNR